ncbi:MAG: asparagine synthase (glutamine-hydrolyzing) [Planctomycetes bacterium]|nr:asparagine synthase (glutamine-hydrolyzing) [Planctomycetota bacterium]
MCGIAGMVAAPGRAQRSLDEVRRMCRALSRRGPDGNHQEDLGGTVFGHARLAIIDLDTGDQPQANEDGSVTVVVNGEIYNYVELRAELEARGHRFRTRSDIEVIPHLYEDHGLDFVDHLRGMFAIALWDAPRRRLVLVRDRLGKKPIYHATVGDRFYFASELKALLEIEDLPRELAHEALEDFFTFQYVPAPKTIFRGIAKVPAATMLVREDGRESLREYWRLPEQADAGLDGDEALERVAAVLDEAVRIRLRSDVPLGAFLSSGIDSTLVVSSAAGLLDEPLQTRTIAFDSANSDEVRLAEAVAARFGTRHRTRSAASEITGLFEEVADYLDEPLGDSSTLPSYLVSKLAREDVKVAISGDGGDESFGGYAWRYSQNLLLDRWRQRLPGALGRGLVGAIAAIYPKLDRFPKKFRLKWGLRNLSLSAAEAYFLDMSIFRPETKTALYRPEFRRALDGYRAADAFVARFEEEPERDLLGRILRTDLKTYLAEGVLAKVDRMSMANSLEVRSPLLDQEMVELAFRLPAELKLKGTTGKLLLRRLAASRVGREISEAPKSGFAPPLAAWLRGDLAPLFRDLVLAPSSGVAELLDRGRIERLFAEHLSGRADHARPLWLILCFESWRRRFATATVRA